jgi:cell fate (sporulation/competence/biofilm development) regulator YlbF (YheA/YmcA/DUF963 family)
MPNIAVDDNTHKEAKKLSKTLDISLGELVQHSVVYFKKTGINPSNADNESPIKAIKELDKHIGQIVAFIRTHEKEKLNPLLEYLIIISKQLDDSIKKLPTAERFEDVFTAVNRHASLLIDSHKKQVNALQKTQQEINQPSLTELKTVNANINNLIKAFNTLHADQEAIKTVIETKLGKKMFG